MELTSLYLAHAFWWWTGVAAVCLVIEVGTGTGRLKWAAASAAAVAVLGVPGLARPGWDFLIFAGLSIASMVVAPRWLRRVARPAAVPPPAG